MVEGGGLMLLHKSYAFATANMEGYYRGIPGTFPCLPFVSFKGPSPPPHPRQALECTSTFKPCLLLFFAPFGQTPDMSRSFPVTFRSIKIVPHLYYLPRLVMRIPKRMDSEAPIYRLFRFRSWLTSHSFKCLKSLLGTR